MSKFDVTDIIMKTDSLYERNLPRGDWDDILKWLEQTVSPAYTDDRSASWINQGICTSGSGWRVICETHKEKLGENDEIQIIGWYLYFDDPRFETLFSLKWLS